MGYVHEALFGSEHLALLASLGRSTEGNAAALVGVQVATPDWASPGQHP